MKTENTENTAVAVDVENTEKENTEKENTEKNKNWTHFQTRWRYLKDEKGEYVKDDAGNTKKYIERCWCGKLVGGADWLMGCGSADDVVQVLAVGNNYDVEKEKLQLNIIFVYNDKTKTIYKNKNNSNDNNLYIEFFKTQVGDAVKVVDDVELPTVQHTRTAKINTLESALKLASTDSDLI